MEICAPNIEIEVIACAECGEPIETRWTVGGGLLPGDYDLVADWIFHRDCWDRKVAEHAP
jgi:hypothetical protein